MVDDGNDGDATFLMLLVLMITIIVCCSAEAALLDSPAHIAMR